MPIDLYPFHQVYFVVNRKIDLVVDLGFTESTYWEPMELKSTDGMTFYLTGEFVKEMHVVLA